MKTYDIIKKRKEKRLITQSNDKYLKTKVNKAFLVDNFESGKDNSEKD